MRTLIIIAVSSYLLGSIPFGYLLVRIFRGEDVRQSGSGNIGATNVSRKSPVLGIATLLLDALKGTAAAILSYYLWIRMGIRTGALDVLPFEPVSIAALFAVIGHMFPVWLKFRGGKGVATGLGSFAFIAPQAVLIAAGIFIATAALFRYVSLGSILAVASFPFLVYAIYGYGKTPMIMSLIVITCLLIIARHHQNIHRLLAGTESRMGAKSA
ncbi:MAG TPA: glycerol-3-phosphate 1-O-acyltransferase PlsY [Verrucomicrobiae bacterium]|jgi:glycerol-3-phosphate acyltransferase PlsY|nr:glycerol-3-phosphate 1-O-acyltransferase PlsY [Verrucomicrobiae bacterium]